MVSTQDGHTVLGRHSSSISEWISVHIGTYCIRMDNRVHQLFKITSRAARISVLFQRVDKFKLIESSYFMNESL